MTNEVLVSGDISVVPLPGGRTLITFREHDTGDCTRITLTEISAIRLYKRLRPPWHSTAIVVGASLWLSLGLFWGAWLF